LALEAAEAALARAEEVNSEMEAALVRAEEDKNREREARFQLLRGE